MIGQWLRVVTVDNAGKPIRAHVVIRGTVQGVGFRPFVHRLAYRHTLAGWVLNSTEGVVIEVEGARRELRRFLGGLRREAPPGAGIERVDCTYLPPAGYRHFTIAESRASDGNGVLVSPDIATCRDCLDELFAAGDRRHRYPFINCTNCGPRFTIMRDVPYDRQRTTMAAFATCGACAGEYGNPSDRRFHAQPNACPECGPRVTLVAGSGAGGAVADSDPIVAAADLLADGAIFAVKGLGGFHLACAAWDAAAVQRLRERKRRSDKPFAVMSRDAAAVAGYCYLSSAERRLLESPARPIVLLRRRPNTASHAVIAAAVAPGSRERGVMLPYSPLHHLLIEELGRRRPDGAAVALVMTSGNASDEPLASSNDEALCRLSAIADYFLLHDREIAARCDDSVTRVFAGHEMLIRRSRGYAPRPLRLGFPLGEVLATGAELKNTFCLTRGDYAFLSQHIGDVANLETLCSYEDAVAHYERLLGITPHLIAHDLHPDYLTTQYAAEQAIRRWGQAGDDLVAVQHHHAHVASTMAEHGLDGAVIGVAFDGTGYGSDGAVWGGEFLIASYRGFQRAAHLKYVPLPGLDQAVRKPFRMAISHLQVAYGAAAADLPLDLWGRLDRREVAIVRQQVASGLNAPPTSSCGRLYDAVASLLGVRDTVSYEGQAALELQMLADPDERGSYPWEWSAGAGPSQIDTAPTVRGIVADLGRRVEREAIAARFHNTVAEVVVSVCCRVGASTGVGQVVLSGGVFQNTLLLSRTLAGLQGEGFAVFTPHQVPGNDGGISLGQAAIAARGGGRRAKGVMACA